MKKQFLFIPLLAVSFNGYSQNEKINAIGISIPVIWNNSEATYYSLGNRKEPTGKATSYGININYSRSIFKNLFGMAGIGYFKQNFGINRPFDFNDPTNLLFYTEKYSYDNMNWLIGIGYKKQLKKTMYAKALIFYNGLISFKQNYTPTHLSNASLQTIQVNNKSIRIGGMANIQAGVEKMINKKISIGFDLVLPIYTRWNDDEIFFEYGYADDTQQIARNKFSIGTILSCNYHFNH
jgi:hypothetical protein